MKSIFAKLPWVWISRVSFALSIVGFVLALPELADDDWSRLATSVAHHAWLAIWLVALSFLARVLTFPAVIAAFLGGFFTSMWVAHTLGSRTGDWLGVNDFWQLSFAIPIVEEVAKLLPVLVVVLAWRWQPNGSVAAIDLAVLGVAAGSGFAIHEDSMWPRISGSGLDSPLGWVLPSTYNGVETAIGHAGWTGLVALTIGIWFVNRRRRWTRLLPPVALALVIADHGFVNHAGARDSWRGVLLDGKLVVGLFLVGVLVTIVFETRVVHRSTDGRTTNVVRVIPRLLMRSRGPRNLIVRWRRLVGLVREMGSRAHQVAMFERGEPIAIEQPSAPDGAMEVRP